MNRRGFGGQRALLLILAASACARSNPDFERADTDRDPDGTGGSEGHGATSWPGDDDDDAPGDDGDDGGDGVTGGRDDDAATSESGAHGGSSVGGTTGGGRTTGGTAAESTTGAPPTTTGGPASPYGDCYDDEGAPLCGPQSCVLDLEAELSACAPDCDDLPCPNGGVCLPEIADQGVGPVCILPCEAGCPGGACGDTGLTSGGEPIFACMWP